GSSTLLVRDGDGRFRFIHRSVLEWLVASATAVSLARGEVQPVGLARPLSPLMTDFLIALADRETLKGWARRLLSTASDGSSARENAELLLARLGESLQRVMLANQDLRGRDLTGVDLR